MDGGLPRAGNFIPMDAAAASLLSEAGSRPGSRLHFLLAQETEAKNAPLLSATPALARRGNLRCSVTGCAAELAAR